MHAAHSAITYDILVNCYWVDTRWQ